MRRQPRRNINALVAGYRSSDYVLRIAIDCCGQSSANRHRLRVVWF
jgi:hypothetical protein